MPAPSSSPTTRASSPARCSRSTAAPGWRKECGVSGPRRLGAAKVSGMEGGFGFPLGGDPEELMRGLREFAEQQAESVQEAQREQFATLTLNTAVELTRAALAQIRANGGADEQALA